MVIGFMESAQSLRKEAEQKLEHADRLDDIAKELAEANPHMGKAMRKGLCFDEAARFVADESTPDFLTIPPNP